MFSYGKNSILDVLAKYIPTARIVTVTGLSFSRKGLQKNTGQHGTFQVGVNA
jgi:hypothetical protein